MLEIMVFFLTYRGIKVLICKEKYAHTGCPGAKICAPGSQNVHTGAGRTLNFEHCRVCAGPLLLDILSFQTTLSKWFNSLQETDLKGLGPQPCNV